MNIYKQIQKFKIKPSQIIFVTTNDIEKSQLGTVIFEIDCVGIVLIENGGYDIRGIDKLLAKDGEQVSEFVVILS